MTTTNTPPANQAAGESKAVDQTEGVTVVGASTEKKEAVEVTKGVKEVEAELEKDKRERLEEITDIMQQEPPDRPLDEKRVIQEITKEPAAKPVSAEPSAPKKEGQKEITVTEVKPGPEVIKPQPPSAPAGQVEIKKEIPPESAKIPEAPVAQGAKIPEKKERGFWQKLSGLVERILGKKENSGEPAIHKPTTEKIIKDIEVKSEGESHGAASKAEEEIIGASVEKSK